MSFEQRYFNSTFEVEERAEGEKVLRGYAAVFNKQSENLGGFREVIAPGAFDDVLENDVRAVFNHDPNIVLGRTTSKTLRLGVDGTGLWYEVDLPNTQGARDLMESVKRQDIRESSFKFMVARDGEKWMFDDESGNDVRTITRFARLLDVSPVTYPAYPDATVAVRSLENWKSEIEGIKELQKKRLQLKRMQLE